ncbi:MAG: outer membrane beta-barrel family protein [Bacteroidales bacterium]|nr:outer membrane beta-barrel family protein [Bacteroidales bacterium]
MKKGIIVLFYLSVFFPLWSQDNVTSYIISGTVTDSLGIPVSGATVVLRFFDTDSANVVTWGVTNQEGSFVLKSKAGHYLLNVRFTGYKEWNEQIQVSGSLTIPTVILEEDVQKLSEITIKDTPIRYRPDGYVVSMVNSPMAKDRTSIEVLNYLPGVSDLKVNGLSAIVYVDDRKLSFSGDDLKAYLEAIPAGDITSIEVIPISGVGYSGSSLSAIIKLTLKKLPEGGGRFYAQSSVNTDKQRFTPKINATLSYRYKGLSFSSFVNGSTGYSLNNSVVKTVNDNQDIKTEQNITNVSLWHFSLTTEQSLHYRFNDRHSIAGVFSTINVFPYHYEQKIVDENYFNNMTLGLSSGNKTGFVNYKAILNKQTGSAFLLVAEVSSSRYNNTDEVELFSLNDIVLNHTRREANSDRKALNTYGDLTLNLSEKHSIETGAKFLKTYYKNRDNHFTELGKEWAFDLSASEDTHYQEDILAGYLNYRGSAGNRITFTAGIRVERAHFEQLNKYTGSIINYSGTDVLWAANARYAINQKKGYSVNFSYSSKVNRPTPYLLDPYIHWEYANEYSTGNPNLKPYVSHTFQLLTQLARSYYLTTRISHAVNAYDFVSELSATGDSIISRPVNVSKNTSYTLNASTSQQLFQWWRLAVSANMTFSDVHTQTYGRALTSYILISANNMFYLENEWGLSLGLTSIPKRKYINSETSTRININGGVQKSFRDGKWILRSEISYMNRTHKKSFFNNGYSERTTLSPRVSFMISIRCNLDFGKKGLRVERGTSDREAQNRIGDS